MRDEANGHVGAVAFHCIFLLRWQRFSGSVLLQKKRTYYGNTSEVAEADTVAFFARYLHGNVEGTSQLQVVPAHK